MSTERPIEVLHVDDDPDIRDLVATALERTNREVRVTSVADAAGALDHLQGATVDCVVSDYQMSGTDGLEFLESVRDRRPELPFILFTGNGNEETASEAVSAGVTDYRRKGGGPDQYEGLANRIVTAVTRRRAEDRLRRSEEKFRAIFNESFDAMVLADDDGVYVDVNPAARELFGLSEDDLIGRTIDEFAPEDYDFEAEWAAFRASDSDRGIFPLVRADGDRRIVEYSATADVIEGLHLSILRDVTDRVSHETRLERQVDQFREFADVISHDLRTPLSKAMARVDLARETGDPDQFDAAQTALERLNDLIDDLGDAMREGEIVSDVEPTDVETCARSAWGTLESQSATLEVDDLPSIMADEDALTRLFENLFKNALEHGSESVSVRVGELPRGFYVEDDGPGIPPDQREAVFDPGYSTKDRGTGFGLVSIRQIALAHGWRVDIGDSSVGGVRFGFENVHRA